MRSLRLAILPLLVAASLAAQAPPPTAGSTTPAAAVTPKRTAFFDVAALVDGGQRFGFEPLVIGRWTVGLVGTHHRSNAPPPIIAVPLATGGSATTLCPVTGCPVYPGASSSDNAWGLDLAVRYYPAVLSVNDPRKRFMVYVGEFVGYQKRTLSQAYYPPLPLAQNGTAIPCPVVQGPAIPAPPGCVSPVPPAPATISQQFEGWEPGAEVGVRLSPIDPVFVDVGGWLKLVRVDDPTQSLRPGQVDARLVVAVGIGW